MEDRTDYWIRQSDAVFEASADSVEIAPLHTPYGTAETYTATLRVIQTHKGDLDSFLVFQARWGDCSYRFESGRRYLVFAKRLRAGKLWVRVCSGTQPLEDAEADLKHFASTGTVRGRVTRKDGAGVEAADVYVFRAGQSKDSWIKYTTKTRSDGNYRVELVPPGQYQVVAMVDSVEPPLQAVGFPWARVPKSNDDWVVEVAAGSESGGIDMVLVRQPVHTVVGYVRTPEGTILPPGAARVILELHLREYPLYFRREAKIRPDGSFLIRAVPQGRFVLRVFPHLDWREQGNWRAHTAWIHVRGDIADASITLRRAEARSPNP